MNPVLYFLTSLLCQFRLRHRFFDVIPILVLVYLTWNSQNAADYQQYQMAYYYQEEIPFYQSFAPGFRILVLAGNALGLNFRIFKCLVILLSLILTEIAIAKIINNTLIVWSYFLFYPGLISLIQIRQTLALSIVTLALSLLVRRPKHWLVGSLLLIILGVMFHTTCLIFIILPFLCLLRERILLIVAGAIMVLGFLLRNLIPEIASTFFREDKVSAYFSTDTITLYTQLVIVLVIIANAAITYYARMALPSLNVDQRTTTYCSNMFQVSVAFCTFTPVLVTGIDFMRIDRAIILLPYMAIALLVDAQYRATRNGRQYHSTLLLYNLLERSFMYAFAMLMMAYFILRNDYDNVFVPLLH